MIESTVKISKLIHFNMNFYRLKMIPKHKCLTYDTDWSRGCVCQCNTVLIRFPIPPLNNQTSGSALDLPPGDRKGNYTSHCSKPVAGIHC